MTDNEIIKALEWCSNNRSCGGCPNRADKCTIESDALALINRQKAEIDILIRKKETLRDEIAEHQAEIERLKEKYSRMKFNLESVLEERADHTEAIKEFAERLKEKSWIGMWETVAHIDVDDIDNLVKEMTE